MNLSFFRPSSGFFEQTHPAVKLLCLCGAFVPPFFGVTPLEVLPYFSLLLVTALGCGAWVNIRRLLPIMAVIFTVSLVLWTFFQPGQTLLYKVGPISIYRESLSFGTTVGMRLVCFILVSLIFLTTTPIEDFNHGLSKLGMPFKAGFAISLAFRLTPLFMETGATIAMAQRARGLDLDSGGLIKRLRRYVPIIVPILISGLRRADQLAIALESKGFGRQKKRSVYKHYRLGWRDLLLCTCLGAAISGMVLKDKLMMFVTGLVG